MGARRRTAAGLALRLAAFAAIWQPQPGRAADAPGSQGQTESPQDPALEETLLRERQFRVFLQHVVAAIADADFPRAIAIGQSVLDADSDAFCQHQGQIVSTHAAVYELLRELPDSARLSYERRYGADAHLLWNRYLENQDGRALRELLRRFSLTTAGASALRHCVAAAFDVGDFQAAVALSKRLAADPHHHHRVTPEDWLRIQIAARITGSSIPELPAGPHHDQIDAWAGRLNDAATSPSARTTVSVPSPDALWSATYFEEDAPREALQLVAYEAPNSQACTAYESWASQRASDSLTRAAANQSLVVDGIVVTRDFSHVVARDLETGQTLWRFECQDSVTRAMAELADVDDGPGVRDSAATTSSQLFEALFAGNSVYGQLSSDGDSVYFVDALPDATAEHRLCNRLVAVGLHSDGSVRWTAPAEDCELGFTFLGKPVVAGRELVAIAECGDEMQLVAFARDSGSLLWRQPICWPRFPLADDTRRMRRMCVPAVAGGIVVCPTAQGLLVGVDASTGTLSWVYSCGDEGSGYRAGRWQRTPHCDRSDAAFETAPLILGNRIVYLPSESRSVHCIELSSGRPIWKTGRVGIRFAETAGKQTVLLVGDTHCSSVAVSDGSQLWRVETGAPVGRGVSANDEYLLPTDSGIIAVHHSTGRIRHVASHADARQVTVLRAGGTIPAVATPRTAGNFAVADDVVVVTSPTGLTVFRQAAASLEQISARIHRQFDAEDVLAAADLELRLGRPQHALERLEALIDDPQEPSIRARAEARTREILFHEIAAGRGNHAMLHRLGDLAHTPEERARHLLYRAASEVENQRSDALLTTALALITLDCRTTVPLDAHGRHSVRPLQQLATLLAKLPADQRRGHLLLEECRRTLPEAGDDQRTQLLRFCINNPDCHILALDSAESLVVAGDVQSAELLLLGLVRNSDDTIQQRATSQLASMWLQQGLDAEVHALTRRRPLPIPPVTQASVEILPVQADSDMTLIDAFDGSRRMSRDAGASLNLLDRGQHGTNPREAHLAVVDAVKGRRTATITLPAKTWRPGRLDRYDAGHMIPIASDVVHGISLLNGAETWTFADATQARETPRIGPFGPTFCAIQAGTTLTVIDPADGRILWQRTDLGQDSGLYADESLGMLGDEHAILVFDHDETGYRLYDSRSGTLIRQDQLDIEARDRRRPRYAVGRRLLYVTSVSGNPHFRLWDPLDDAILATGVVADRFSVTTCENTETVVIVNGDRLEIRDGASGQTCWTGLLDAADTAEMRSIDAWCDNGSWCVHFARNLEDSQYRTAGNDVGVPHVLLRGDLLVIDQATGQRWQRTLPPCNLLRLPQYRLPVLIGVSRIKDSQPDDESRLALHVVCCSTGETLLSFDDLPKNEIVATGFDEDAGTLELYGKTDTIRLQIR